MSSISTFKLILVGDSGVGKTTWVTKLRTSTFVEKHVKTLGVEVHPLRFDTTHGQICFNVWDLAGCDLVRGLGAGYYVQSNCALFMFDNTRLNETIPKAHILADEIAQICGQLPCVVVGNKCEGMSLDHSNDSIFFLSTKEDEIDVLSKPFLKLARLLMNQPTLEFL